MTAPIRHTFAPLPHALAMHHFGDPRTTDEVCRDIAAAQARRRGAGDLPPPDHQALGLTVSAQLGHHAGAIRRFFRQAEEVALLDAGLRSGQ